MNKSNKDFQRCAINTKILKRKSLNCWKLDLHGNPKSLQNSYRNSLEFSMAFFITELVYIFVKGPAKRTPPGAGISRALKICCLLYGRVVVSLTHSRFPFSILFEDDLYIKRSIFQMYKDCISGSITFWILNLNWTG